MQEWRLTICVNSRYKNELVHILDMCRLLHFKGYRFPRVSLEHSALAQPDMLKSAEELEAEDQAVNAAVSLLSPRPSHLAHIIGSSLYNGVWGHQKRSNHYIPPSGSMTLGVEVTRVPASWIAGGFKKGQ